MSYKILQQNLPAYAKSHYEDPAATLDDLNEAVTTLEEIERIARRVLGDAHPLTTAISELLKSRPMLRERETGDVSSLREAVEAMTAGDA